MTSPRGGYGFKCIPSYNLRKYWRLTESYSCARKSTNSEKKEHSDIFSVFSGSMNGNSASNEFVLQWNTAYLKPFYDMMDKIENHMNIDMSQIKTPAGEYLDRVIFNLSRRIIKANPKITFSVAQTCAEKYHHAQCKSVDILFSDMLEQVPGIVVTGSESGSVTTSGRRLTGSATRAVTVQRRRAFCVMENFLDALIEMGGVLLPQGFSKKFLELGYSCLQKEIFLQYVERGLITVTKEFVWSLYERNVHVRDSRFFYMLLCKLSTDSIIDILLSKRPPPMFFVEYMLSRCPRVLFSRELELDEKSPFYPLSLILQSMGKDVELMKSQQDIDVPYLTQDYKGDERLITEFETMEKMIDTTYFYTTLDLD